MRLRHLLLAGLLACATLAQAQTATPIAFVGALSGSSAAIGRDQLDGFLLALAEQNGRLGGVPVTLLEFDDRGHPKDATEIADRLIAQRVRFVTGITTRQSALVLNRKLHGKQMLVVSSGIGPIPLAGERCSAGFVSIAPAEDAVHENAGAIAAARRYAKVYLVSPILPRATVEAAFRRGFKGELLLPDGGVEPAATLREIRAARPDAVYFALSPRDLPGFLRAYQQAGLFHRIPAIAPNVEPALLESLGPEVAGLIVSVPWAASLEEDGSAKFAEAFKAKYGRMPSSYAKQGYDAAMLLGDGFRAARGKPPSPAAVAKALQPRLAVNRYLPTDWYAWEVFNESNGAPYLAPRERTLSGYVGPHAERCKL